ncbi:MAG: CBS domain-containing protein [Candidatus Thermoplasmatota archaeon]|nr:CBS domain-containing protein [Candidatus Thermoplasmatota archaeon]
MQLNPLNTISDAIKIMTKNNIKKLPVVIKGEMIGIITTTDVSRARPELSKRFIDSWVKPE